MKRAMLILVAGFAFLVASRVEADVGIYTFESLSTGGLQGQDNWKWNGQAGSSADGIVTTPVGSGNPSTRVGEVTTLFASASLFQRIDDGSFDLPSLTGATRGVFQFDGQVGTTFAQVEFGVGHDANSDTFVTTTEVGWRYGIWGDGAGRRFFQGPDSTSVNYTNTPTPISASDWLSVRLDVNFTGSTYTLSYKNLTTGESSFSVVPGLLNKSFTIAGPALSTWDALLLDVRSNGQIDNLMVESIPEPSTSWLTLLAAVTAWRWSRRW